MGSNHRDDALGYMNGNPQQPPPSRHYIAPPPPPMEPPRPLEPRPTLPTTLSESHISTQVRHDPLRVPSGSQGEPRPQGQSLPGLRDILSPPSTISQHSSYGSSWGTATASSSSAQSGHDNYRQLGLHPPMVLHPPTDGALSYQSQHLRAYERSPLDLNHRRQSHSLTTFSNFSDPRENYTESRPPTHVHAPSASHLPSSFYAAGAAEDSVNKDAPGSFDRFAPPGSEGQKKYIGVQTMLEGTFHCYEGGFRIPTHVDGEQVNPAWGLTKANKPRKRLALACLDCREKKIKCEPGTSSCIQCEKAKRPCRRAPPQLTPDTIVAPAWPSQPGPLPNNTPGRHDSAAAPTDPPLSELHTKRRPESGFSPPSFKKPRSTSPVAANHGSSSAFHDNMSDTNSVNWVDHQRGPRGLLSLDDDPYGVNPESTLHLLNLYFAHTQNYSMFPRHHFMRWVTSSAHKGQNERTVLFAMLAYASFFADNRFAGFGNDCARAAGDAVIGRLGRPNMCVALARTLLGLYNFAKGSTEVSWDHIGAAMAVVLLIRLYTEDGCRGAGDPQRDRSEFGFSPEQVTECRRRIFWVIFVIERDGAIPMCTLKPQDVFLRLPCSDDVYERALPSEAPMFHNGIVDEAESKLTPTSPVSPAAWLITIAAIMGDVQDFSYRSFHRGKSTYCEAYETFYSLTNQRLSDWESQLPQYLRYSEATLDQSIQSGYAGIFIALHSLYHYVVMKLNRGLRHAWMPPQAIHRNIQKAHAQGHAMLQMMNAIREARREITDGTNGVDGQPEVWTLSVAFAGLATLMAIDIVTAGGIDNSIKTSLDEVEHAGECLREIGQFWSSARDQWKICEKRFYQIKNVLQYPQRAQSGAWLQRYWGMERPLQSDPPSAYDCIYGLEDYNVYYGAFGSENGDSRSKTTATTSSHQR